MEAASSGHKKRRYLKHFLRLFMPYRKMFFIVVGISVLLQAMDLIFPLIARNVMDEIISGNSKLALPERHRLLWTSGACLFCLAFGIGIATFFRGTWLGKMLWRIVFDLRQRLSWHLQRLSLSFFAQQKTGKLVSRLISDINQCSSLINQGLLNLFLDIVVIVVILIILWTISPLLTCLSIAALPVYMVTFRKLNPRIRQASKDVQRHIAVMSGSVQERLSGIALIQSFSAEQHEHKQFTRDNQAYTDKVLQRRNLHLTLKGISTIVVLLSNGIVLIVGGFLATSESLSPGDILAFLLFITKIYGPLGRLSEVNVQIQQALGSLERVFDLLDLTPDIRNAPDAVKELPGNGHLLFENLFFEYENNIPVLKNINLEIIPGQKVAIVGPSGSGKSTMAALVPRLYDVSKGRILIDSVDVRKINLEFLRNTIGIVQQEPFLFSTTVRENISYGRPSADIEEIIEAAKVANADEFIVELPEGYDTVLGERGINLSGGQRQRVCLARTILKNPKILILDEATSSLDSESENLVQSALEKLMKNRTSLIIAHRLSTIMSADFVVVLDQGKIVEQGTHAELWQNESHYRHLLEQQYAPLKGLVQKSQI